MQKEKNKIAKTNSTKMQKYITMPGLNQSITWGITSQNRLELYKSHKKWQKEQNEKFVMDSIAPITAKLTIEVDYWIEIDLKNRKHIKIIK